jgi:hypothetical protein
VAETRAAWLARSVLLARLGDTNAAHSARYRAYGLDLAPRDPGAGKRQLDLSEFFTAGLDTDWRGSRQEHHALPALPRGRQILGGLEHDLRGLVQLSTPILERRDLYYPRTVSGIPVHQPCRRLHFLHAADSAGERGSLLAVYTIHREDGGHDTIEVRYGEDVLAWDAPAVPSSTPPRLVWREMSPAGFPVWLFQTSWTNARPELDVTTIDLTSAMTNSAPFVVAITAE